MLDPSLKLSVTRTGRMTALATVLALALLATPASSQTNPNFLVILIDDLGIEHVGEYQVRGPDPDPAYAPLDKLTARLAGTEKWIRFERAWSNPYCSPTRATFLTGLYGKETGIGDLVDWDDSFILDTNDANLIAKKLGADSYETAIFGKWHLGGQIDDEMIDAGFDYFEGTLLRNNETVPGAIRPPYEDFRWTTSSASGTSTTRFCRVAPQQAHDCANEISDTYLTKHTVQAAMDWIQDSQREDPWFVYLALQAPHSPWYCPPSDAYIDGGYSGCATPSLATDLDKYYAMLQVVDEQIDRLLNIEGIDLSSTGDTVVFLLSDNGSPNDSDIALDPVDVTRAKGTVFEGGVRVPFFAGGPSFDDGTIADSLFINVSDLYATILDLTGLSNPHTNTWEANQSKSFKDYLLSTAPVARVRDCMYTEYFAPNGDIDTITLDTYNKATAAITTTGGSDVWKYVEQLGGSQIGLFNLSTQDGEWEDVNECASGCSATEDQIISELLECRDQFYEDCQLAGLDEDCDYNSDCCAGLFYASVSKTCKDPI